MDNPNRQMIDGLREMADWLEEHPLSGLFTGPDIAVFPESKEQLATMVRGLGGIEKDWMRAKDWFTAKKVFAGGVEIRWNIRREAVCERVKVGEKTLPAEPEHAVVIAAKPERVEPVYEWKCPESILAPV